MVLKYEKVFIFTHKKTINKYTPRYFSLIRLTKKFKSLKLHSGTAVGNRLSYIPGRYTNYYRPVKEFYNI